MINWLFDWVNTPKYLWTVGTELKAIISSFIGITVLIFLTYVIINLKDWIDKKWNK